MPGSTKDAKAQLAQHLTKELMTLLEDVVVTTRIIAFERYNFICRKQKKKKLKANPRPTWSN